MLRKTRYRTEPKQNTLKQIHNHYVQIQRNVDIVGQHTSLDNPAYQKTWSKCGKSDHYKNTCKGAPKAGRQEAQEVDQYMRFNKTMRKAGRPQMMNWTSTYMW